jgi:hypothetical protein
MLLAPRLLVATLAAVPPAPLPACPSFSDAGDPHACVCEVSNSSSCRGVTPRFNWIIGLCKRPEGEPGVGGSDEAAFPGPGGSFKCADPMRLRPGDTAPSNVSLRYLAAYQWGNPCEEVLGTQCPAGSLRSPDGCRACVSAKGPELSKAGCSAGQLAEACDSCAAALRNASWTSDHNGAVERCSDLRGDHCNACLGANQRDLMAGRCTDARLHSFCTRNWTLVPESSLNTDAAADLLDLPSLVQPGGAAMWNEGAYLPGVRGLRPPGMMWVISCKR